MTARSHPIAVQLKSTAFETLKQLSARTGKPYAGVIADALNVLANASASQVQQWVNYASLPTQDRRQWRSIAVALRADGLSPSAIGKRLYHAYRLAGADGLPLSTPTIRGMLTM